MVTKKKMEEVIEDYLQMNGDDFNHTTKESAEYIVGCFLTFLEKTEDQVFKSE